MMGPRTQRIAYVVWSLLVWPSAARASDLTWSSTPECASRAEVMAEVSRVVRGVSGPQRRVDARVKLVRSDAGVWRVVLVTTTDGASRTRSFEVESCEAAVEAISLILAIEINPQVVPPPPRPTPPPLSSSPSSPSPPSPPIPSRPPSPAPAPAPAPTPTPTPAPAPTAPPAPLPSTSSPSSSASSSSLRPLRPSVSLASDAGALPNPAVGLEVALAWRPSRLDLELAGTYWAPQSTNDPVSSAGARFELLSASARAAYLGSLDQVAVGPLLGIGLERFSASGFGGTAANGNATEILGALSPGALLVWSLGEHFAVRLALESVFPLSRPTFVVLEPAPASSSSLHRPSAAFGRALLGAELSFW
jgi:hypothetical protein